MSSKQTSANNVVENVAKKNGLRYLIIGLIFTLAIIVLANTVFAPFDCVQYDDDETGCTTENASIVCEWRANEQLCDPKMCWSFNSSTTCQNASLTGLPCTWDAGGSFCSEIRCDTYDDTDVDTCQTNIANINCTWDATLCNEMAMGCQDYDEQESSCLNTNYCIWTPDTSACDEPEGEDHGGAGGGGPSPGCFMFMQNTFCNNVTGCSWNNNACTGAATGIQCTDITESSYCNAAPMFSTCCAWNSGVCNSTFSNSCWDNMRDPPTGADYCEDYNAVNNESMCGLIAGEPWFFPCTWSDRGTTNTSDDTCTFNGDNLFIGGGGSGAGHFEDIGSKTTCESAGGIWKTESYIDPNGAVRQDSWCEMMFGISAKSCDSACWACEFQPDESAWTDHGAVHAACEASLLGFCSWRNQSQYEASPNGMGFCEKPPQLQTSGCGTETNCEDYTHFTNPQQSCEIDPDCKWITDPEDANLGWCSGMNTKICSQSCSECKTELACSNNGSNCNWDQNMYMCKGGGQGGSSAEICFDGVDNDNDNMIDCGDSNCMSEPFCGGMNGDNNCGQWQDNATCSLEGTDCTWITDPYTNGSWCGKKGENCWQNDDSEENCNNADGCQWSTTMFGGAAAMCDINDTYFNMCWSLNNNATCSVNGNCTWVQHMMGGGDEGPGGFCDAKPFSCMNNYFGNEAGCNADLFCNWTSNPMMMGPAGMGGGGMCEGMCFGLTTDDCNADSRCESRSGWCEPEGGGFMGGGCWQNDGNQTACVNKTSCAWMPDPFYDNDTMGMPDKGWCSDGFMVQQFAGMEGGAPTMLAMDDCSAGSGDASIVDYADICGIGIKMMSDSYGFGMGVDSIAGAGICKNRPLQGGGTGSGESPVTFYLYLDTDGINNNNCDSGDSVAAGFEFYFKYQTNWTNNQLSETKVAYKCISGNWAVTPIAVSVWAEKMCKEIGGGMLAINKETLESDSTLFNKSAQIRVYGMTVAPESGGTLSSPTDAVGPGFYSQGSIDFRAEDCKGTIDQDGDGCAPKDDPDCQIFHQFGFFPFEDCFNGIDDNFDGAVDCDDPACKYDPFACSGTFSIDLTDMTPPGLAEVDVKAMPDSVFFKLKTYEPSNATLNFYVNDTICTTVNTTIYDSGYKPWHGIPLDNYAFNPNMLGFDLTVNTTYNYKYILCDVSDNCLVSACSNFTTPVSYSDCGKACNTYLDPMDFAPPADANATVPLGNLTVGYDIESDGDYDINKTYGDTSTQKTLNETTLVSIKIENPTSDTPWSIECVNGTVPSTVTFNSSNIAVNESAGNGRVGMPTDEYKNKFQSDFMCKKINIEVPYTGDTLYHCTDSNGTGTSGCTDVTSQATRIATTATSSTWQVDPSFVGFSYFQSTTAPSGDDDTPAAASGGGGGGGGAATNATSGTTYSRAWQTLSAGETEITISKANLAITEITFSMSSESNDAEMEVISHGTTRAEQIDRDAPGAVKQYIEISTVNINNDQLSGISITFEVSKTWLSDNSIDESSVRLYRYSPGIGGWVGLPTTRLRETDDNVYYEASSTSFSHFAIVGEDAEDTTTISSTTTTTVAEPDLESPTGAVLQEPKLIAEYEEKEGFKLSSTWITGLVILFLVGICFGIFEFQRREHKLHLHKKHFGTPEEKYHHMEKHHGSGVNNHPAFAHLKPKEQEKQMNESLKLK